MPSWWPGFAGSGVLTWRLFKALPRSEQVKLVAWFAGKAIDMGKVRLFLQGKKTYLVGLGAIIAAVTAWSGDTMNDTQAIEAIVAALVAMFIRAGVTTEVKNLKK